MPRFLLRFACLVLLFSLQIPSRASATMFTRHIDWHFTNGEAQRLFQYLASFQTPERILQDQDLQAIGDPLSFGCSNLPECFLVLSEPEWKLSQISSGEVYDFLLPFGGRYFSGRITIAGSKINFQFTDTATKRSFHFLRSIECPASDCSLTTQNANVRLVRQESSIVVDNLDTITLRIGSQENRTGEHIYLDAALTQKPQPWNSAAVQLGPEFFCFHDKKEMFCQAVLKKVSKDVFLTELQPGSRFSLIMKAKFEKSFLLGYDLWYSGNQSTYEFLGRCPAQGLSTPSDCGPRNGPPLLGVAVPFLDPIGGGGIAVGWGREQ